MLKFLKYFDVKFLLETQNAHLLHHRPKFSSSQFVQRFVGTRHLLERKLENSQSGESGERSFISTLSSVILIIIEPNRMFFIEQSWSTCYLARKQFPTLKDNQSPSSTHFRSNPPLIS